MAAFATENDVRLKFQLTDSAVVSSALIVSSIAVAHEEIMQFLDGRYAEGAEGNIVAGESLLAGARLLESLASKDAAEQKQLTIGGQRIEAGSRFNSLMAMSALAERSAWRLLEPYLADRSSRDVLLATDSVDVLGGRP